MENKNTNNEILLKSILVFGNNVKLNGFELINYKVKDLYDPNVVGLINYYGLIGVCMEKPENIFNSETLLEQLKDFLNIFTNKTWATIKQEGFLINLKEEKEDEYVQIVLGKENIAYILDIFKKMYCLDDETVKKDSDREDLDEEMRELLREFEKEQEKICKATGTGINLTSIIDSIACKHNSLNMLNIGEYTIYQLYSTFKRLMKIDNENRMLTGFFAGTIKLNKDELAALNWASEK